jgi:hypothetical protein
MKQKINNIVQMFAHYGFAACPLTRKHIARLLARGHSQVSIYGIGCDVNAGFYSTK